ncbi:hypothetical protein RJ640_018945 [Escallonia rubra]|uniref:Ubiquitin-like domain-containing protein n=1 Tax=Escallonia rubra TaxID=112253 RepID=A0AA88RC70_9ASTE|nr:hypothetical protein RJ640_018945 [Escallonia rubra]
MANKVNDAEAAAATAFARFERSCKRRRSLPRRGQVTMRIAAKAFHSLKSLVVCDPFAESVPSGSSVKRDLKRKAKLNFLSFGELGDEEKETTAMHEKLGDSFLQADVSSRGYHIRVDLSVQGILEVEGDTYKEYDDKKLDEGYKEEYIYNRDLIDLYVSSLCEDMPLRVNKFSTIKDLKDTIRVRSNLEAQDQRLVYHGTELEDDTPMVLKTTP